VLPANVNKSHGFLLPDSNELSGEKSLNQHNSFQEIQAHQLQVILILSNQKLEYHPHLYNCHLNL